MTESTASHEQALLTCARRFLFQEGALEGPEVGLGRIDKEAPAGRDRKVALCPHRVVVTLPKEFLFLSKIYLISKVKPARSFRVLSGYYWEECKRLHKIKQDSQSLISDKQ